jgi:excinuclease ABC subunit A
VLELTVEDAYKYFSAVPNLARKLQTLLDVGLGYIRLGQSATTLSVAKRSV